MHLRGATRIAEGVRIDAGCVLDSTQVGPGAVLKPYTVATETVIGARVQVGPFAHLRPGSVLEDEVHMGNFVETKKTRLGRGAKANHLAYLGDAEIGAKVNVGAGTITCNYDGVNKMKTVIDDGVFIGSDTQLVAPVSAGEGCVCGRRLHGHRGCPRRRIGPRPWSPSHKGGLGGGGAHKNEKVRYGIKLFVGHRSGASVRLSRLVYYPDYLKLHSRPNPSVFE